MDLLLFFFLFFLSVQRCLMGLEHKHTQKTWLIRQHGHVCLLAGGQHIFSECKSSSRAKPGTSQESPYSQEIQSNPLSNLCEFKKRKEKRNPAEICKHRAVQDKCCQYLPPCVMKLQKWRSGLSHCGEFNSFKHQKTIFFFFMKLYAWTGVHLSCSLLCYICVAQEINSHSVRKENEMTVSLSLISLCLCVSLPIPLSAFLSPCENLITQQTQGIWQPTVQLLAHIHLFLAHLHGRWKLWRFAAAAPLFLFERGWSPTQHRASALTACFVFLSAGTAQFGPNKSLHSEPHIGTIRELVNASVKKKKKQKQNHNKTIWFPSKKCQNMLGEFMLLKRLACDIQK